MAPRKQAPKPKTVPPSDDDWWKELLEENLKPTTTTVPSTTTTSSGTSTTRTPATLSPDVKAAEQKLRYTAQTAQALGIDTGKYYKPTTGKPTTGKPTTQPATTGDEWWKSLLEENLAGTQTAQPKKEKDGFLKWLGKSTLSAVGDVVNVIDMPRRALIAGIDEGIDLFTKGDTSGSFSENFFNRNYGFGDVLEDADMPMWLKRGLGFAGDVLLDPVTYLTLGGSAIAKTSVKAGTGLAVKEFSEATAEELRKVGVDKLAIEAAQKTAKDLSDEAVQYADDLTNFGAGNADELIKIQQRAQRAAREANDLVFDAAKKLDGRGGKILKAEDARQAAYQKWAGTIDGSKAQKDARKELDKATSYLARQGLIRGGVRRQYRATAREILGENATQVRNLADNIIKAGDAKVASGLALNATEEAVYNAAARTVADLNDDVIAEIYKRGYGALRGAGEGAGLALGTRTGTRIGVGRASTYITKGRFTGIGGSALTKLRANAFARYPGVLEMITPLGRRGIFADADLLKMRRALQTGKEGGIKLTGEKAKVYGAALALQRAEEVVRKKVVSALTKSARTVLIDISDEEAPLIRQYLEDGVRLKDVNLQAKADAVRGWLDSTYKEYADRVAALGDNVKTGIDNYFPHAQSTDALEWMARNPRLVDDVANNLGVTRQYVADNFIERQLVPGRIWFGHVLTADDISGGVTRLNQIARESGGLKFDFFETDLKKALGMYAKKHAANVAFLDTVESLAGQNVDEILRRLQKIDPSEGFLDDITKVLPEARATDSLLQRAVKDVTEADQRDIGEALDALRYTLQRDYTSYKLKLKFDKAEVSGIENKLRVIRNTLDDIATQGDIGLADQFLRQVDELEQRVREISQNPNVIPLAARLTLDEIDETIQRVLNDIADLDVIDTAVDLGLTVRVIDPNTGKPLVGASIKNILELFARTPDARWRQLSRVLSDGFEALGMRDIQDIGARQEVIQMFNRLQQVTDSKFAAILERRIGDFNTFFKSWSTATLGFHFRNAMSNAFQLVAAGVSLDSSRKGLFYYNKYITDTTKRASRKGGKFLTPDEWVQTLPSKVSDTEKRQIADALYLTGADGQMSEVFDEARRIGVSGKEVGDTATLRRSRGLLGSPLKTSRAVGQYVEGNTRFIMNFDGLRKGLDPTETLARTNKYLFDYQNLSSLDRVARNIIPFWIWTSRNFPLYLENIVTNPRAYARYGQFRRATEGEESPYMPEYLKESGAFTLRPEIANIPVISGFTDTDQKYFRPDFGFPGAGRPSQLELLTRAVPSVVAGEPDQFIRALRETLGSATPLATFPIEMISGRSLFRDKPIASRYSEIPEAQQRLLYGLGRVLPGYQYVARQAETLKGLADQVGINPERTRRIVGFVAPETEAERIIGGIPEPYTKGLTEEEIAARAEQSAFAAIEAFIGTPIRGLTEGQQISEINRRIRALEELILRERNARGL